DAISRGVFLQPRDRFVGRVDRNGLLAAATEDERESTLIAEAVEQPAVRVLRGRSPILALIEKQPRLLSAPQVHVVVDAELRDRHCLRDVTGEHLDALLEAVEHPYPRIVACQDAAR